MEFVGLASYSSLPLFPDGLNFVHYDGKKGISPTTMEKKVFLNFAARVLAQNFKPVGT